MSNRLINETSPYLLQHSENPVDWYPWGKEAFDKARAEDKPVFVSIGYSTCHWCHVMAHESFENKEIADILNKYFVSIKVDREQRPDIDSIYMSVCQSFTGSGGWPMSIFMTADQKPFFAGTYFPQRSRAGMIGFGELLLNIRDKWKNDRKSLLNYANKITGVLSKKQTGAALTDGMIIDTAVEQYKKDFDKEYGGFGSSPKFPAPHNLLFLMLQYERSGDKQLLDMAEKTLVQMYKGGIFDHIGYGFCRYSTDRYFLVPHFEKMLYDNALLISAYCKAYEITKNTLYLNIAEKTAFYVLSEMTSPDGGFFSAQDADSDGVEGKYYLFEPDEIINLLGKNDGVAFNRYFSVTYSGNFEGKSIPNLLNSGVSADSFEPFMPALREYRRKRCRLNTDDKILTSWNSLMTAALCSLYRVSRKPEYLEAAEKSQQFIEAKLHEGDVLYVSFRDGRRGEKGFLDDYAYYAYALLCLYEATLDKKYLESARKTAAKAVKDFYDSENGGFYLYGSENEKLIFRPKESYDGAMPSGNSMMTYVLVRLSLIYPEDKKWSVPEKQLTFMQHEAQQYPAGYALFLSALTEYFDPPESFTVVLNDKEDVSSLPFAAPLDSIVRIIQEPTQEYKLLNGKTTYYICRNHSCLPPVNEPDFNS